MIINQDPSLSMARIDDYREQLRNLKSWDTFLLNESCLPGPRANLELAFAVALEGSEEQLLRYADLGPDEAPKNSREEFIALCGVIGLGYLAARGGPRHFTLIRAKASDPRWRIREAVALGLQKFGEISIYPLLALMTDWCAGSLLERRAVVATLCEQALLADQKNAKRILDILDDITAPLLEQEERRSEDFRVLRKALGYGWSVAVVAHPEIGRLKMERWIQSDDRDILWIMRNNLKKNRLTKMDSDWVRSQVEVLRR